MTVVHGKETKVYVSGYDLTGYFRSATLGTEMDLPDATTFGNDFKVVAPGIGDATASLEGLYEANAAATAVDDVFAAAMAQGGQMLLCMEGDAFGAACRGFGNVQSSYEIEAPVDDLVQVSAEFQTSTEVDRCKVLAPLAARVASGQGAGLDNLVSSAAGLVGYLQVMALNAGTLTVKLQHSVDGVTWVDLDTFTVVGGGANVHEYERRAVAAGTTINRHLRASWTLAGGATTATFVVAARRK